MRLSDSEDFEFTFYPDPSKAPQASGFWPLLEGEVDDRVFKYVGVTGVDKPRIVQVGIEAGQSR